LAQADMLLFWLAIAAVQLLFSASVAPAKSLPGLENRAWKISTLAAQTHQQTGAQVTKHWLAFFG
jgi:hypothetical protein